MKDFKVAEIVPVAQLEDTRKNHYHMCLAHLVKEDQTGEYAKFYKEMSIAGKYVLMDNGAAENSQLGTEELLEMYAKINPTEIVLPDTLNNSVSTIRKTFKFLEEHRSLPYKFMAVPQGNNLDEWKACANIFIRDERINSIGISKFLNIATKDKEVRLRAALYVEAVAKEMGRKDLEIHLLGCDEGPAIVSQIRERVPMVRGCDSAFVYIATQANVKIDVKMERPAGEIDFLHGERLAEFENNASQFETLVGVYDNEYSVRWRGDMKCIV